MIIMDIKDFNWDEVKEKFEKAVKLEEKKDNLSIKITILEANIEENQMVGSMLKSEEEMKRGLSQFLGNKEPIDCYIDINQDEKWMLLKFKNKKDFNKVYNLLNDIFFGDYLKKMMEALMGAFGQTFGDFKPDNPNL